MSEWSRPLILLGPWLVLLGSCSSPPQAPSVDASTRRPANSPVAVALQGCRSELQNTRIVVAETTRLAESASASATRLALREVANQRSAAPAGNTVYTVHFGTGESAVVLPDAVAARLVADARDAPLIMLRGRTDGDRETVGESRVARDRTEAVRIFLVRAGVAPGRIRATFQAVGDPVADNTTTAGRALNRRVEIEVYRAAPRVGAIEVPSAGG